MPRPRLGSNRARAQRGGSRALLSSEGQEGVSSQTRRTEDGEAEAEAGPTREAPGPHGPSAEVPAPVSTTRTQGVSPLSRCFPPVRWEQ